MKLASHCKHRTQPCPPSHFKHVFSLVPTPPPTHATSTLAAIGARVAALVRVAPPGGHGGGGAAGVRGRGCALLVPGLSAILGRKRICRLGRLGAQVGHALQQHILAQDRVAAVFAALCAPWATMTTGTYKLPMQSLHPVAARCWAPLPARQQRFLGEYDLHFRIYLP